MSAVQADPAGDVVLVRDSARAFATRRRDFKALRAGRTRLPWQDATRLAEMAELGWFGTVIPAAHGGLELGFTAMAAIVEELGGALLAEPLVPLAVLAPRAIVHGDNAALQSVLLPQIAEGKRLVALAWQDAAEDTTAQRDGAFWRLTGRKRFVAGAWAAQDFIVSAGTPDGLVLLHVPADAAGLTVSQEWRADGSPTGLIELLDVRVPADAIVASPARANTALQTACDEAAIMVSAELVGVMRAALATTLAYMRTRVAFGRPIASFQALQHRAADLHVRQELAAATLVDALRLADAAPDTAALGLIASRTKARSNQAALQITREAIQLHGGIGFTDECDIGLYLKRALVLAAWLGGTAAHHARIPPYAESASDSHDEADAGAPERLAAIQALPVAGRDWNSLTEAEFRACARTFFATNLPQHLRFLPRRLGWSDIGAWYLKLSQEGWLAPTWPTAYGGMGLSPGKLISYFEEMERLGGPRLLDHGINNVGSILLAYGTEAQRQTWLPKILSGEHIWCQGYSEPNAGSDLASLRTQARLDGDTFVITGQKIWTTLAHEANHIYALVRTDPSRPGRDGISFLLIDLRQPGVTIRPIRNIAGHQEFCEVFFDEVRTPRDNIVGALNDGWAVSRAVLGFERLRVGSPRNPLLALQRLSRVTRRLGLDGDPLVRARLIALACDVYDLTSLYERAAEALKGGAAPGPEASVLKIWATETEQRLTETLVEVLGDAGTVAGLEVDALTPFLSTRATTIYGGTNEVQRNIIARRILKL